MMTVSSMENSIFTCNEFYASFEQVMTLLLNVFTSCNTCMKKLASNYIPSNIEGYLTVEG